MAITPGQAGIVCDYHWWRGEKSGVQYPTPLNPKFRAFDYRKFPSPRFIDMDTFEAAEEIVHPLIMC